MHLFRTFMQFVMKPDEPAAGAPPVEPAAVVPEPVAPAPVPTPAAGDAPWAADLAGLFPDETVRGQVDGYLRTKVQPHTTQLQQQLAAAKDATELYADFQKDPLNTFLAVGEQLFEPDEYAKVAAALGIEQAPATPPAAPTEQPLDPRVAKLIADDEAREAQKYWDGQVAKLGDDKLKGDGGRLLAPFVVAAEGDFEKAHTAYKQHVADMLAAHGVAPTPATAEVAAAAPAVLGTGDGSTIPPATTKQYTSVDDALDDTLAEMRAAREAPAVI